TYRTGGNRGGGRCGRKCARQASSNVLEITGTHDVVAIDHGARPMPGYRHRHTFRYTRVDHAPNRRASTIVPQHPWRVSRAARALPDLSKIPSLLPEHPLRATDIREQPRDDARQPPRKRLDATDMGRYERFELWSQIHRPAFIVLGSAGVKS